MSPEDDAAMARIKSACEKLGEHHESVQIFCTNYEKDGTKTYSHGSGNWFARYGQIRTWILKQDEFSKLDCNKEYESDDE